MAVVDIQFSPANTDWPTLRTATREADARGYGCAWVLDHLAGLPLDGSTMIEACTLLGALAATTERIGLGTMVANVWNRAPGTLVSAAASAAIIADRPTYLGVGAGTSPTSSWAAEQHAVGHVLEAEVSDRHARVVEVLDLADREWRDDRDEAFATFPLPRHRPTTIVGANSVALCRLAARHADGINLQWSHPRRDQLVAETEAALGGRPFVRTAYTTFAPELLDPDHPTRRSMAAAGYDRVVLAVFDDLRSWLSDERAPGV